MFKRLYLLVSIASLTLLVACGASTSGGGGTPNDDPSTGGFEIVPLGPGEARGNWSYEFDATASGDVDSVEEYRWNFGGVPASIDWSASVVRGYGRNGTYQVSLETVDSDGKSSTASKELVVDDLPYDFWGLPPELVNESAAGTISNAETDYGYAVSDDGRYVLFATTASNLGPADENGLTDIYLKDMETGAVELISRAAEGIQTWRGVAMTGDARYVAFTEEEVPPFGTGPNRILVVDRETGTSQEVVNPSGFERNLVADLSSDGRKLLYFASTLNNPEHPAWVHYLDSGSNTRLGFRTGGTYATWVSPLALSSDGRVALFATGDDQQVFGDTNERWDLFVTNIIVGETNLVSSNSEGEIGNSASDGYDSSISADGRYVTFSSDSTNFPGGVAGQDQVYLKDLSSGELELISQNAFGEAGNSDSVLGSISDDGRYVAFGSYATNLVPFMDTDDYCIFGCPNGYSYVKDRETGRVSLVSVGLNDSMPNDWDQIEPLISGNGEYATFYAWATNLVESASEDRVDYYRARNPLWEE